MKKKFLLMSFIATIALVPATAQEVVFNFNDPTSLEFAPETLAEMKTSTYNNGSKDVDRLKPDGKNFLMIIDGETISKEGIGIQLTKGTKSFPRLFWQGQYTTAPETLQESDFICDLRWYAGSTLTISVPQDKVITKVVMTPKDAAKDAQRCLKTNVTTEGGKQTINNETSVNEWIADEGSQIKKLVYTATDDAPTQVIYSLAVTLEEAGGSGISEISVSSGNEESIYNLAGIKCNPSYLTPGIYIRKSGDKISKIMVK